MANNDYQLIRDSLLTLTTLNQDLIVMNFANILIRHDYKSMKIPKLITGDCCGVDLNSTNLIGDGMLTATILGTVNSPPTTRQILQTIHELLSENSDGILMIVNKINRLTFKIAYHGAIRDKLPVEMIEIDDCQMVIVSKILGAMAAQRKKLDEIYNFYKSTLAPRITSIEIEENHDKSQRKRLKLDRNLQLNLNENTKIIVMLNSKQSKLYNLELINEILKDLQSLHVDILRFCWGNFDKNRDYLIIIKDTTVEILDYFNYPSNCECWRQIQQSPTINDDNKPIIPDNKSKNIGELPLKVQGPKLNASNTKSLETTILFACEALISCEFQLNKIDSENSHGNIGTRFRIVFEKIKNKIQTHTIITNHPQILLESLSILLEDNLQGILGSIYGSLFKSAADKFREIPEDSKITPKTWLSVFDVGLETFKQFCDNDQRLTTMYFPLCTFYNIFNEKYCKTCNLLYSINRATYGAEKAAEKTKLSHCLYPDSGAHAVGLWLRAVCEGVKATSHLIN